MKAILRRKNVRPAVQDRELAELEDSLKAMLSPVGVRATFVSNLKEGLLHAPPHRPFRADVLRYLALVTAGILSGIMIVATGVRLTLTLLAALGLIHKLREQEALQKAPAAVQNVL